LHNPYEKFSSDALKSFTVVFETYIALGITQITFDETYTRE